jgi:hypothetical protein
MAIILSFPSSRQCRAVRVERERENGDLGGWLTLAGVCGELHGDFGSAIRSAHQIAAELGLTRIVSSAGTLPC